MGAKSNQNPIVSQWIKEILSFASAGRALGVSFIDIAANLICQFPEIAPSCGILRAYLDLVRTAGPEAQFGRTANLAAAPHRKPCTRLQKTQ